MYAASANRPKTKVRRLRDLFVLRKPKDDGIVVHRLYGTTLSTVEGSSLATRNEEGEAAMKEKIEHVRKAATRTTTLERGINLDVLGRTIIAQADERIRWHKQTARVMEAELKTIAMKPASGSLSEDWKHTSRRTDLQNKIGGHLEYAKFLDFVRRNIVRDRRYRLALSDMSLLEIMPKGTYW